MRKLATLLILTSSIGLLSCSSSNKVFEDNSSTKEFYELRIYETSSDENATLLDRHLSDNLIPMLNTAGIDKIGVFEESASNRPPWRYVLISYDNVQQYLDATGGDLNRNISEAASSSYKMVSKTRPVYDRIKSSFFEAFDVWPKSQSPLFGSDRIFQLRIYESQSEDAGKRKVHMFNNGEIPIFNDVGLTPVFFGEALSGHNLPNLTYMLTFKDEAEMKKAWEGFLAHPDWAKMKEVEMYKNTVSYISNIVLKPLDYSQL